MCDLCLQHAGDVVRPLFSSRRCSRSRYVSNITLPTHLPPHTSHLPCVILHPDPPAAACRRPCSPSSMHWHVLLPCRRLLPARCRACAMHGSWQAAAAAAAAALDTLCLHLFYSTTSAFRFMHFSLVPITLQPTKPSTSYILPSNTLSHQLYDTCCSRCRRCRCVVRGAGLRRGCCSRGGALPRW